MWGFGVLGVWGCGVWGLGFETWGLGLEDEGVGFAACRLGFGVWGLRFWIWGFGGLGALFCFKGFIGEPRAPKKGIGALLGIGILGGSTH